ncbi:MAG: GNAT family N-acetyltransferase [Bacteroidetes bacterium]|nr:GNAT family N-acetyltransferase [Bacteroidota bacterium]
MPIRHATLDDLPAIVAIYNASIPSRMVTADLVPVTVEDKTPWFLKHNSTTRPLWVLEEENEIKGWLSFENFYGRPAYNATAEISIYIAETQQGKGLGKYLLTEAINAAPAMGINTLLGFIFGHNEPSLKLFLQFDFTSWAHLPKVANLDGVERDLVILGKAVKNE